MQYTSIRMLYLSTLTVGFMSTVPHCFAFCLRAITASITTVFSDTKTAAMIVIGRMIPTTTPTDTAPACTRGYT